MIDFAPADIGDDAVGAGIIAAAHASDKRGNLLIDRGNCVIEVLVRRSAVEQPPGYFVEILDGLGTHDQIDKRKPVFEIFLCPLCGAAADHDFPAGPLRLPTSKSPDLGKCAIFRLLADHTSEPN